MTVKSAEWYLNNYKTEELLAAFDRQDVCVSYSGNYRRSVLSQVHNSCELLFVEKGRAEYQVNDEVYQVEQNTVLIIGATDRHRFTFTEVPYIRYGLTVMPSFLQSLPIINGYMNVYRTQSLRNHHKLIGIDDVIFGRMIQILWQLREETQETGAGRGDMVYALMLELTVILKRLLNLESQNTSEAYKSMNEIKNHIDLCYGGDLSLGELSRRFFLQPNTISKNFRKVWGKNINQYINSVRITNAVRILESEEIGITELSEMVGYSNVNTFLRQFREKMDVSPLQYKKRMKQAMADIDTRQLFENEDTVER
nr:AraC family transcriptional regulator [Murimonas intestini]